MRWHSNPACIFSDSNVFVTRVKCPGCLDISDERSYQKERFSIHSQQWDWNITIKLWLLLGRVLEHVWFTCSKYRSRTCKSVWYEETRPVFNMCQRLNSHYFHIIGDGKNQPNSRGLYTHYKDSARIPIKGWMTIPKKTRLLTMAHIWVVKFDRENSTYFESTLGGVMW